MENRINKVIKNGMNSAFGMVLIIFALGFILAIIFGSENAADMINSYASSLNPIIIFLVGMATGMAFGLVSFFAFCNKAVIAIINLSLKKADTLDAVDR